MKLTILGSRGIPAGYGGFETLAERLSKGLTERGHEVTVYCLKDYVRTRNPLYHGVKRVFLPSVRNRVLEKPFFALLSLIHASFSNCDCVLMLGISVSAFCFIPRIFGKKVVIHVDGLEWQRRKWGAIAKIYLRFSEKMAFITTDKVITDSRFIVRYFQDRYNKEVSYIPYGADVPDSVPSDSLERYGLRPWEYILQSCRIEPENNVHLVIEAYLRSKMSLPLVILGDAPPGSKYKEMLLKMAGDKVRFLGFVFGPDYQQIVAHAGIYIHAHEVGGTNPSLLEAMAVGQAPLYLDVPFNREVCGEIGFPFRKDASALSALLDILTERIKEVRSRAGIAKEIIRQRYSWQSVIDEYEALFKNLLTN